MWGTEDSKERGLSALQRRFERVLKHGSAMATAFAVLDVIAAVYFRPPNFLAVPGALLGFVACTVLARRALATGRTERAALIVSSGVIVTILVCAIARPTSYPVLMVSSLLASLIVLPYLRGEWLRRALALSWGLIVAVATSGAVLGRAFPVPTGAALNLTKVLAVLGVAGAAYFSVALIWQFSQRLWETVDDEKGARALAAAAERRASFLAAASAALSRSLDYRATIATVAELAVPTFADWCTVSVVDEHGLLQREVVRHADPEQQRLLEASAEAGSFSDVMATGSSVLTASPGSVSRIAVPMKAHGRLLGVVSFHRAAPGASYEEPDLLFAEELAYRAAMAIENARLYENARLAVKVRDDFLTVAGHEMRTPLAALLLQVQTLQRVSSQKLEASDPELSQRLTKVGFSAQRMARLVNELLDVSRITAGRLELQPEPVDLAALSKDVVARFTEQAQRSGTLLVLQAPDSLLGLWDRMRLEQVLTNLIENGIKYGQRRPVEIELSRLAGHAMLRVRDRGIGIAPTSQKRIFERFERAVHDKHYGGLGLGLRIVRQVVEASGGTIEVQSTEGEGATFIVALPLETPSSPEVHG